MIDYTKSFTQDRGSMDEGLRSYMLKIYNFMAMGLLVTGVFAYATLTFLPPNIFDWNHTTPHPFGLFL